MSRVTINETEEFIEKNRKSFLEWLDGRPVAGENSIKIWRQGLRPPGALHHTEALLELLVKEKVIVAQERPHGQVFLMAYKATATTSSEPPRKTASSKPSAAHPSVAPAGNSPVPSASPAPASVAAGIAEPAESPPGP